MVFVPELALAHFARHGIALVLSAAATSAAMICWLVEPEPLHVMPSVPRLPGSLGMALATGWLVDGLGWVLLGLPQAARADRRAAVGLGFGGVLVSLLSAAAPDVWGNGYSIVSEVLQGRANRHRVAVIPAAKPLATIISSGSEGIGGVFTPTLSAPQAAANSGPRLRAVWVRRYSAIRAG